MTRALRSLIGIGAALLPACQAIPPQPLPPYPVNDSCGANDCGGYGSQLTGCSGFKGRDICIENATLSYVLVVSVPDNATGIGGTVVLSPSSATNAGGHASLTIPSLAPSPLFGAFLATPGDVHLVGRNTFNDCQDLACFTTLPVQATLYPQYNSVDAASLGLPLLPVVATPVAMPPSDHYSTDSYSVGKGPPSGWTAEVPLGQSYVQYVSVDAPFNASFPPDNEPAIEDAEVNVISLTSTILGLTAPVSLKGWTVYVQDIATLRRISNTFTVPEDTLVGPPPLFVSSGTRQAAGGPNVVPSPGAHSGWQVVVQPADPAQPVFTNTLLGNQVALQYPKLAPAVHVRGNVAAPTGPAPSTIVFASDTILLDGEQAIPEMTYQTTVETGADGSYAVVLPAGSYDATVTPNDVGLPKIVVKSLQASASLDLSVPNPPTISGKCYVADGLKPLAMATVEITPAVAIPGSAPPAWQVPRPVTVTTDGTGAFSAKVDEGTYDVTVKPALGSNFPWFVSTAYPVSATVSVTPMSVTLPSCTIPAPVLESFTLVGPGGAGVPFAIVRAYTTHQVQTSPDPTFHEIGLGVTDANGSVDLFLTALK